MNFVVDASVSVKWYIPEIYEQEASKLLTGNHHLHAPELILPEFCNVIWMKVRRAEITKTKGEKIVDAFSKLSKQTLIIHSHKKIIKAAFAGAESSGKTVYDWTYLALAISLSCEMFTADSKFYKALENTPVKKHLRWIEDI